MEAPSHPAFDLHTRAFDPDEPLPTYEEALTKAREAFADLIFAQVDESPHEKCIGLLDKYIAARSVLDDVLYRDAYLAGRSAS